MSRLFVHGPDEDAFDQEDVDLIQRLRPAGLLAIRYDWPSDKGAAEQVISLVRELGHRDLLVRFERRGDRAPIPQTAPYDWAENCAERMAIYDPLRADGVTLHAIPANESNLPDPEGGHRDWKRHADWMADFADGWRALSSDPLHLPAPARMPIDGIDWNVDNESLRYWQAMKEAGVHLLVQHVDCHAYRGDFLRAIQECYGVLGIVPWVTESNGMPMEQAVFALDHGLAQNVVWFSADWRNYSRPWLPRPEELPDNGGVHMSIRKWPELQEEWLALESAPLPLPQPAPPIATPAPESPPLEEAPMPLHGDALNPVIFEVAGDDEDLKLALLALAEAESSRRSDAERWAYRDGNATVNVTKQAQDAIGAEDWDALDRIIGNIVSHGSVDVSFGAFQQTARWAAEGDGSMSRRNILDMRARYFEPVHATQSAANGMRKHLARAGGEVLLALCYWNRPRDGNVSPAVLANYQRGLDVVSAILKEAPMPAPTYAVGSGLLGMMDEDKTEPAMPSVFLPLGQSPAIVEEGMGLNGTVYRWHLPTGKHWRFPADPKAA